MQRSLHLAGIALALVLTGAGGYAYFLTLINNEIAEASELASEVERKSRKEHSLQAMQSTIRAIQSERQELDSYFLQEKELIEFLETIEDLGGLTQTAIAVKAVSEASVALPDREENAPALRLTIEVDGPYRGVFHAISLLELFPLPLAVHEITLERTTQRLENETPVWRATVMLSVTRR